jgi:hypothetical protein
MWRLVIIVRSADPDLADASDKIYKRPVPSVHDIV